MHLEGLTGAISVRVSEEIVKILFNFEKILKKGDFEM